MADTATATSLMTAEEFYDYARDRRCELIDGAVVEMAPAGDEHSDVELGIMADVRLHVDRHRLGRAYGASLGVNVARDPDTVLQPDGAFVARSSGSQSGAFLSQTPDLVLEVISPTDRMSSVVAKAQRWLAAGVKVVWVADPQAGEVMVWRSPNDVQTVGRDETLTCEDLLPGFALPLSDVFRADE